MATYTNAQRDEDIKTLMGQEIEGFKFKSDSILHYHDSTYKKLIGKKAIVQRIHEDHPYSEVHFLENSQKQWYPLAEIREQVRMNNRGEDELYGDIYALLKRI